ncbi:MAG: C40 family peptidase [Pseudomonadota bacterium]
MAEFDRRLTPARADLAARSLEGQVGAKRFVDPQRMIVTASSAPLRPAPDAALALDTELLHGEPFDVYDEADGWVWGQSVLDGYVGYLPADTIGSGPASTHRIVTLTAQIYAEPTLKKPPMGQYGFAARVAVAEERGGYARLAEGWVAQDHLRPLGERVADWVSVAETFLGVPYVWGGRSAAGLDCSALVQLALQAGGIDCPRDTDMQFAIGTTIPADAPLKRGDLIFWKGHVGIMLDAERMIHATAFTMQVRVEPLEAAARRIEAKEFGMVQRRARLDPVQD